MRAFSLVELSIVLVILGLLTGGILSGQSLIRAAELRSISSDFTRIHTALMTYQDKYFSIPGDHNNAFRFFGTNCAATADECNGDGNGFVGATISGRTFQESYQAINHLALTGLIEGSYTGVASTPSVNGTNIIPSKLQNAGFWFFMWNPNTYFTAGEGVPPAGVERQNWIHLGGPHNSRTWNFGAAGLSPQEAWGVDAKIDDGKPGLGRLFGPSRNRLCSNHDDQNLAEYDVAATHTACSLGYKF